MPRPVRFLPRLGALSLSACLAAQSAGAVLPPGAERARVLQQVVQVAADRLPEPITALVETEPGVWRVSGADCAMTLAVEYLPPEIAGDEVVVGPAPFRLRLSRPAC